MKPEANKNSLSQLLFLQTMSLQAATKQATKESFAGYICLQSYLRLFSGNSIWVYLPQNEWIETFLIFKTSKLHNAEVLGIFSDVY